MREFCGDLSQNLDGDSERQGNAITALKGRQKTIFTILE